MAKEYFPNGARACYGSALANLLIEMGDRSAAEDLTRNYREHRLVLKDGSMHAGTATRILSELTDGRYVGTLQARFGDDLEEGESLKIMREEMAAGRIIDHQGEFRYTPPGILLVMNGGSHWIVDAGNGVFIDNGQMFNYLIDSLKVSGVLQVRKT